MALIYLGVIHFLEKDIIKLFLWSFGAFVLIYTGIESVKMRIKLALVILEMMIQLLKAFFLVFMSLSNPLTILFWLGIFGSILAKAASSYNKEQLLLYSFGTILGIFIWDITMASTSSIFRKILNTRILSLITVISGISLIIYGLYFGFQTYQIIFQ